ncbi:MAG TPA: hypothetical protein VGE07_27465 [Herpetosiphonaceae bacterium]
MTTFSPAYAAALGRIIDPAGQPIDGKGPLAPPADNPLGAAPRPLGGAVLETGVKVIDLYAPLVRGGLSGMWSQPKVGKLVAIEELIQRAGSLRGAPSIVLGLEEHTYDIKDLMVALEEGGAHLYVAMIFCRGADGAAALQRTLAAGLELAAQALADGRDALLFIDADLAAALDLEPLRQAAAAGGYPQGAALTSVIFGSDDRPPAEIERLRLDGSLRFSGELAAQNIWPAIDPLASESAALRQDAPLVSSEHVALVQQAREVLRQLDTLPAASGEAARGRKLRLFQSQPFFVAESFSAVPGEYVSLAQTIADVAAILAGAADDLPEEALRFSGSLGPLLGQPA